MRYSSFNEYFDKYCEEFLEEFLKEVEEGNYMNNDEDFFEFMSYKFESSIGDSSGKQNDQYGLVHVCEINLTLFVSFF